MHNCKKHCDHCDKKCSCPAGVSIGSLPIIHHTVTVDRTYPPDGSTLNLNVVQISSNTGGRDILMVHGYPHSWALYQKTTLN